MNRRIPYKIEYTKNKHSRALFKDETIVIRLAKNLTEAQKKQHIKELLGRMSKHVASELVKNRINPFTPLLQGESMLSLRLADGREYAINLEPTDKSKIRAHATGWTVFVGPSLRKAELHRMLWKALSESEEEHMKAKVHLINETTLGVSVKDVSLKHAKSQWGSCASSGKIMLNTSLLFVPEELQDYVIVHELAHRLHPDHSPRYWKCVESVMSDFDERRKKLKQYRLCSM